MPIERLIVVSGPKAVGKSHLITRLRGGLLPKLRAALEIGDPASWEFACGFEVEALPLAQRIRESLIERLVLHYEITRPWNLGYDDGFLDDEPTKLLRVADDVRVLTLWAPCDLLLDRFLARNPRFRSWSAWLRGPSSQVV